MEAFLNLIMGTKKVKTEIFIHNNNEKTIMLETDSAVFVDDISLNHSWRNIIA